MFETFQKKCQQCINYEMNKHFVNFLNFKCLADSACHLVQASTAKWNLKCSICIDFCISWPTWDYIVHMKEIFSCVASNLHMRCMYMDLRPCMREVLHSLRLLGAFVFLCTWTFCFVWHSCAFAWYTSFARHIMKLEILVSFNYYLHCQVVEFVRLHII